MSLCKTRVSLVLAGWFAVSLAASPQSMLKGLVPQSPAPGDAALAASSATIVNTGFGSLLGTFGASSNDPDLQSSVITCLSTGELINEVKLVNGESKTGDKFTASVTSAVFDSQSGVAAFELGTCKVEDIPNYSRIPGTCSNILGLQDCQYFAIIHAISDSSTVSEATGLAGLSVPGKCVNPVPGTVVQQILDSASDPEALMQRSSTNICPMGAGAIAGIVIATLVGVGGIMYGGLAYAGIVPAPSCVKAASSGYGLMSGSNSGTGAAPKATIGGATAPSFQPGTSYQQS